MLRESESATYTEFCQDAEGHLSRLKKNRRPTYIVRRGRAEAVLLTARQFRAYAEGREYMDTARAVEESRAQFAQGLSRPWGQVKKSLRKRFGMRKGRTSGKR